MSVYYIAHYGVKGMKWGVRRYQNADGSYTQAGLARRKRDERENAGKKSKNRVNLDDPTRNAKRWVHEDEENAKNLMDRSADAARRIGQSADSYSNRHRQSAPRKNLSKYSDQELREAVNRELLERQYNQLFNTPTERTGAQKVRDIAETSAAVLSVASAALSVGMAIKKMKG